MSVFNFQLPSFLWFISAINKYYYYFYFLDNNLGIKLDEKVRGLVDGKNFGNIATIMSDGSPQVSPVWINRDGDSILVNTAVGRTKQKNLVRDPRVALTIYDQENPYTMAMIRGTFI